MPDGSYRALDQDELALMPHVAKSGVSVQQLSRIADALDSGNLARAQLLGLQLPLAAKTPLAASDLAKAGFNEQEQRNAAGEWTIGGAITAAVADCMGFAEAEASAVAVAARAALAGAPRTALAGAAGPVGAAAGLFAGMVYPSGNWQTFQGALTDHPDINYRYDEGELSLYQTGTDGKPALIYRSRAGEDGLYRDAQGNVVGRDWAAAFR